LPSQAAAESIPSTQDDSQAAAQQKAFDPQIPDAHCAFDAQPPVNRCGAQTP
jgi:hypothetical protein